MTRRHIERDDIVQLQRDLAEARKLHPIDDKLDVELKLDQLLRLIQRGGSSS